ncbi:MAG: hypothetical protein QT10_C0003G0035 [archaeon GW2011_AR19]|nr:MAG: hypothetical protein QT10_C0003G0035 [archaeon GW2011_AR19]
MDCCSAGHNHAEANAQEKRGGVSWVALIIILLIVSLLVFSILK